jgi:hypothetical protein
MQSSARLRGSLRHSGGRARVIGVFVLVLVLFLFCSCSVLVLDIDIDDIQVSGTCGSQITVLIGLARDFNSA